MFFFSKKYVETYRGLREVKIDHANQGDQVHTEIGMIGMIA